MHIIYSLIKATTLLTSFWFMTACSITESHTSKLFKGGRYPELIQHVTTSDSNEIKPETLHFLAKSYTMTGKPEQAKETSLRILETESSNPNWLNHWAHYEYGHALYVLGDTLESKEIMEQLLNQPITNNLKVTITSFLNTTGMHNYYTDWKVVEKRNIRLHFPHDTKVEDIESYASVRQNAFDSINKNFKVTLPKKIDFFVWNKTVAFPNEQVKNFGFAVPRLVAIHLRYFQTPGHEIAHVITHYYMKNFSISHFINEGTAVFFNQSTRDHYASAQATVENESPSIKNVWQSYYEFNGSSREAYYSIGGAFIQFLIEREGMDKFLAFISDQSYEHGVEIYGEKLEQIITDFETMLISG